MVAHNPLAYIREDLLERNLAIPVGRKYYSLKEPLKCRWKGDWIFQVYLDKKWRKAESIDWNFISNKEF
jgi:hypothetical protein